MRPGQHIAHARQRLGYSQDDLANALGVSRVMVSYWESGTREPNDRQLTVIARLLHVSVGALLGDEELPDDSGVAWMLFRGAEEELAPSALPGLKEFEEFLDTYADLAEAAHFELHGLTQSPFLGQGAGFSGREEARRKAEEVRASLRLGLGSVGDVDMLCELLGVTVYRSKLGGDLRETISGAFFNHPRVGFAVLVNLQMTPGRRRFTVAHELGHALFHSDKTPYVLSGWHKDPKERFADAFAGEFLMPTEGIRRVLEEHGMGRRVTSPAEVIHLQRFFEVSYETALVRLRQARLLTAERYEEFKAVRPVVFARALGYEVDDEQVRQDPGAWRVGRFPHRFIRLLRLAVHKGVISVPTAGELTGLTVDEVADLVSDAMAQGPSRSLEIEEFEATGVPGDE